MRTEKLLSHESIIHALFLAMEEFHSTPHVTGTRYESSPMHHNHVTILQGAGLLLLRRKDADGLVDVEFTVIPRHDFGTHRPRIN